MPTLRLNGKAVVALFAFLLSPMLSYAEESAVNRERHSTPPSTDLMYIQESAGPQQTEKGITINGNAEARAIRGTCLERRDEF